MPTTLHFIYFAGILLTFLIFWGKTAPKRHSFHLTCTNAITITIRMKLVQKMHAAVDLANMSITSLANVKVTLNVEMKFERLDCMSRHTIYVIVLMVHNSIQKRGSAERHTFVQHSRKIIVIRRLRQRQPLQNQHNGDKDRINDSVTIQDVLMNFC